MYFYLFPMYFINNKAYIQRYPDESKVQDADVVKQ